MNAISLPLGDISPNSSHAPGVRVRFVLRPVRKWCIHKSIACGDGKWASLAKIRNAPSRDQP